MTNRADAHTPIPWAVNPFFAQVDAFSGGALVPVCQMLWPTESRTEEETLANAARIVLAVNSHDALVEALTDFTAAFDKLWGAGEVVGAKAWRTASGETVAHPDAEMRYPALEAARQRARGALSKATGETR